MIGNNPSATLPSYDETALCSAAFRIMRSMVNAWLREVAIHRNVFSDFQIVHFYRWIRSSSALLYDPALRRNLNNLMRKMFLQIIAEFQRLGAEIIYADFNRIILNSGKKNIVDAISYVEYIVQSIRNKELFHSINLTYQQCWEHLLWMDTANFGGPKGKIPKELQADLTQNSELVPSEMDDQDEVTIEMNWNIAENLPEEGNCREDFESIMSTFMDQLANRVTPAECVQKMSYQAYEVIQRLHKGYPPGKEGPALYLCNAICKVLFVNKDIEDEVTPGSCPIANPF